MQRMSYRDAGPRPKPDGSMVVEADPSGPYGVPQTLLTGFQSVRSDVSSVHPLEHSEKHWNENKERMDMVMLKNIQGIHAPMKIMMERNTAKRMQRLPPLHSSNLMHNVLTGEIDNMEFDDFLNDPADAEAVGNPHMMMEKQSGIL